MRFIIFSKQTYLKNKPAPSVILSTYDVSFKLLIKNFVSKNITINNKKIN